MNAVRKKYRWESRYSFDSKAILKDFKTLDEFREAFGVKWITYWRGFNKVEKYSHIPQKYIIDKITSAKILLCKGAILAKNKEEATHILEIKNDGKLVLKKNKRN